MGKDVQINPYTFIAVVVVVMVFSLWVYPNGCLSRGVCNHVDIFLTVSGGTLGSIAGLMIIERKNSAKLEKLFQVFVLCCMLIIAVAYIVG